MSYKRQINMNKKNLPEEKCMYCCFDMQPLKSKLESSGLLILDEFYLK